MPTIRAATEDDVERILALEAQAFNVAARHQERARPRMKLDRYRVAETDRGVVATMRALPFAHFFGGRAVEAAGISGVAVSAEARGQGVGSALMRESLAELRARHVPISSLYPATAPIYRSMGYGYGGVRTRWHAPLARLPQDPGVGVETFGEADLDEIDRAHHRIAVAANGLVRRDRDWWVQRVLEDERDRPRYAYAVREDGDVTGWIVYFLQSSPDTWRSTMACRDLFWRTPAAARALLSLGSLHRSTSEWMEWIGPPTEPLGDLLPEDVIDPQGSFRWMVRLLDVPAAFEARGYNTAVDAEVTIGVEDPLFPENAGPWRIQVAGGSAKVAPAETADARAHVGTWASIWSRLHTARDAARIGGLSATADAIDALDAIFAGPLPWIADFY